MASGWLIAFLILLLVIWIVAGGFITQASIYLTPYKGKDDYLNSAYWFTFWAAFVTWFIVAVVIIIIILGFVAIGETGGAIVESGQAEQVVSTGKKGASAVLISFIVVVLLLAIITGILAAIAASDMHKSSNIDLAASKPKTAYTDCIVAASLCLGAIGVIIIGGIIFIIVKVNQSNKQKELRAAQEAKAAQEKDALQKLIAQKIAAKDAVNTTNPINPPINTNQINSNQINPPINTNRIVPVSQ